MLVPEYSLSYLMEQESKEISEEQWLHICIMSVFNEYRFENGTVEININEQERIAKRIVDEFTK